MGQSFRGGSPMLGPHYTEPRTVAVQQPTSGPAEDKRLTEQIACRVFGWRAADGRFLTTGKGWTPMWRFRPLESISDAFRLLHATAPQRYLLSFDCKRYRVEVEVGGKLGEASAESPSWAITVAVARAIGIEV